MHRDTIALAEALPKVLSCGLHGTPSNLIELLHLENVVDFTSSFALLSNALDDELSAFGTAAVAPIDAALAGLPESRRIIDAASTDSSLDLLQSLEGVRNVSRAMNGILPAASEPGLFAPDRVAWVQRFAALYGTPALGPDQEMVRLNAQLRTALDHAANLTLPLTDLVVTLNASADAAGESLVAMALCGRVAQCGRKSIRYDFSNLTFPIR